MKFGSVNLLCLALLLQAVCARSAFSQGTVLLPVFGQALATHTHSIAAGEMNPDATITFRFGFSTEEANTLGVVHDSLSGSVLAADNSTLGAFLFTTDVTGTEWIPLTPGYLTLSQDALHSAPAAFPNVTPVYARQSAWTVSFVLPSALAGHPANFHFDLFNNQDAALSMAVISDFQVVQVPEPGVWLLASIGLAAWRCVRKRGYEDVGD